MDKTPNLTVGGSRDMETATFEKAVFKYFGFLISDFGYRHVATDNQALEMWVTFEGPATAVVVTHEVGSEPWVELARLRRKHDGSLHRERTSLELLLRERAPEEPQTHENAVRAPTELIDLPAGRLEQILEQKAKDLRQHGADILQGDFSIMPRLKVLAAENELEAERFLFGAETERKRER